MSYRGEYFDANWYLFMTFSFLNTKAAFLYLSPTDHVTDHKLITWLSCTAHVADHAMIT